MQQGTLTNAINWQWTLGILVSILATEVLVIGDLATPLRPVVALWFLLVCPGMAFVQLLRLRDPVAQGVLAIALSLTLELVVASVLVYAGWWSPVRALLIMIALCIVGLSCQLFTGDRLRPAHAVAPRPLEESEA